MDAASASSLLRVGFVGDDFFGSCLSLLRARQDVEVALLAVPSLSDPASHMAKDLSRRLNVPLLSGKPDQGWVNDVNGLELDLLVVASYKWLIPVGELKVGYALNVHPSLLPEGRGPNPLTYFVNGGGHACGVTIHKLSEAYDSGDILVQESIPVSPSSDVTDLYLEMVSCSARLLEFVLDNLEATFSSAVGQSGGGCWWPRHDWETRTFEAEKVTVEELRAMSRKYGLFGLSALFPDGSRQEVVVRRAVRCTSAIAPGRFVQWSATRGVLAVSDGYVLVSMSALV